MATLQAARIERVTRLVRDSGAARVMDLGCGTGELLEHLVAEPTIRHIVGIDLSPDAVSAARSRLEYPCKSGRVSLELASFTDPASLPAGFDAALLIETIEHLEPSRLSMVEYSVFTCARPRIIIMTTPNQEYNVLHGMAPGTLRHPGHWFEWGRWKFRRWANGIAQRNGYAVRFEGIGIADPLRGTSTQLALFSLPGTLAEPIAT